VNSVLYSLAQFVPALLTRYHGASVAAAGLLTGLGFGIGGGFGMLTGGVLGDLAARRSPAGRMRLACAATCASAPAIWLALRQQAGAGLPFSLFMASGYVLLYFYYSNVYATIQDVVEPPLRATAMALYFLMMYALGGSLGPFVVGAVSDHLARAASGAGVPVSDAARAAGLHAALYLAPALALVLGAVLWAGARSVTRDVERLRETAPA